ncbi:Putative glutathione-specific gamma-glutamylcyclotransferase 2 [Eumeta japonica]|uniref:glutathione-specific gamma-glutamylcyclotransferase n=1 Tax=Eumeta variegata TaxID=151549 RepID=A0A4C1Z652_EUMVA|nr:Putative glutathione-specific gamma-glutamylcyclotransferase 2 [Eumeta japonica]
MWIFGYGSLTWKVDFLYEKKLVGYITGYNRRFYQHSVDHRGIPEKPGRVVTLIPSNDAKSKVWGIAYKIPNEHINEVTSHLDFREKNGYSKQIVTFHPADKSIQPFSLIIYVATEENESFAGPDSIENIAKQIISCHGPSGSNKEYVYNLAKAMRDIAPNIEDEHLFSIEEAVRKIDSDL